MVLFFWVMHACNLLTGPPLKNSKKGALRKSVFFGELHIMYMYSKCTEKREFCTLNVGSIFQYMYSIFESHIATINLLVI